MNAPEGFEPFPDQGPFLEYVGPIHLREGDGPHILGVRARAVFVVVG